MQTGRFGFGPRPSSSAVSQAFETAIQARHPPSVRRTGCLERPQAVCQGSAAEWKTPFGGVLSRRTYNPLRGDVNPGKKSSKFNQDCTICRSCREAVIGSVVLEQRENRVEQREFSGTVDAAIRMAPVRRARAWSSPVDGIRPAWKPGDVTSSGGAAGSGNVFAWNQVVVSGALLGDRWWVLLPPRTQLRRPPLQTSANPRALAFEPTGPPTPVRGGFMPMG